MNIEPITIPARDGYALAEIRYESEENPTATAVPQLFSRHFAAFLAEQAYTAVTCDYRGIAGSRPEGSLRGFVVQARDWALLDDDTLPLERFDKLQVPVLAYSFEDDDWGTSAAVVARLLPPHGQGAVAVGRLLLGAIYAAAHS